MYVIDFLVRVRARCVIGGIQLLLLWDVNYIAVLWHVTFTPSPNSVGLNTHCRDNQFIFFEEKVSVLHYKSQLQINGVFHFSVADEFVTLQI